MSENKLVIPKQLEDKFAEFGVCTVPEIAACHQMRKDRVLAHIKTGKLPALDTRTDGNIRPCYKITRAQILQWYENIAVVPVSPQVKGNRRRRSATIKEFF